MHLAKVIGTVVASQKSTALTGVKMLVIQPIDEKKKPKGRPIVATDPNMQAGPGTIVTYIVGREATLNLPNSFAPVDAGIVGIVDGINVEVAVKGGKSQ